MNRTFPTCRRLTACLAAAAVLAGVGCRSTKEEPADDAAAAMREARTQLIEQMKASGASASQIRAAEKQFDEMERQVRSLEKQAEKLEKENP